MGIKEWLFGTKGTPHPDADKPPMFGGDALTPQTAITVNCASMAMANSLITDFITERHGPEGQGWVDGIESFVRVEGIPDFTVRAVGFKDSTGLVKTYYFKIARPMAATKKMMGI